MPALAALITTVGRAALTANAFAPVAIHVGSGTTVPTNATTALATPEAIIAATVQAQQVGDDVRLHVVALDSTTDAYDVREWALVDAGGDFLAVYGSATLVAAKAAGSHLHLALDVVLEEADVGSITIGSTDYLNPAASETVPGLVELATSAEVSTGTDPLRAVTPLGVHAALDLICASNWRREVSGLPATDVFALAHDGARRWVAVGDAGLIATSDNLGETWTTRTPGSAFGGRLNAVFYAAGLFVAVGQAAEVQTSPDGVTWTSRNSAGGPELRGVTYDGTGWIAVGDNAGAGYVITAAAAAVTWTVRTAPTSTTSLLACASDGAGVVVAVGDRASTTLGQVSVSTDHGVTWTSEQAPALVGTLEAITYGADGVWYAGGQGGDIISAAAPTGAASSSDWTTLRSAADTAAIYGIAAPGGGCVVASRGGLTASPADPLFGHGGAWRVAPAPTAEGAFGAHYAVGMIMMGLDGGGVLRSQVFGHRL